MAGAADKKYINDLSFTEVSAYFKEKNEPDYRASQIYEWIHKKNVRSFDEMSNIPASLRRKLSSEWDICVPEILKLQVSKIDGTRKYALRFRDGNIIETVLMKYKHGNTLCVSSQAGCRMGCKFCASGMNGLSRNLTAGEILSEVYTVSNDTEERISNVVLMGTGEPLDNFDEVIKFISMLNSEKGYCISERNITLSTCGLVPEIKKLASLNMQIGLAVSLHATDGEKRKKLMPIAKKYGIKELLDALSYYHRKTGKRISIEYSLICGENDSPENAAELAGIAKRLSAHINLISLNPVDGSNLKTAQKKNIEEFMKIIEEKGANVTLRRRMGRDIDSACGQLRRRFENA